MTLKQKLSANKTAFGTCCISTSPHFVNGTKVWYLVFFEMPLIYKLSGWLVTVKRIEIVLYNKILLTIKDFRFFLHSLRFNISHAWK